MVSRDLRAKSLNSGVIAGLDTSSGGLTLYLNLQGKPAFIRSIPPEKVLPCGGIFGTIETWPA